MVLDENIIAQPASLLTLSEIIDAVRFYIIRNCKNVEYYKNDIPIHFNDKKTIQYSYLIKGSNTYNVCTNAITILYNNNNNKLFKIVDVSIIDSNIRQIFAKNGLYNFSAKFSKLDDILKCCFVILELFKQKILRVYFPLTNNYSYFYKGNSTTNDSMNYIVTTPTLSINMYNQFLSYLTGCNVNSNNAVEKINLFFSFLYTINANAIDFDNMKNDDAQPDLIYNHTLADEFHCTIT